jgi:hypothetical protein
MATQATNNADKQYKRWLWPSEPVADMPDEMAYELKASANSRPIETIHYNLTDHTT